ncbi:hypothetical protein PILCRDRAFT_829797 [Piloderma croceum F 1598]|uniref:Uncharacterized protein n=1 Tax=Piloderma croceum (strain F 1598) TaxID=765440 RepID=A0A0C3AEY1_PILCF|nr:hypothetical protein PILCRDRAFT_829797 [Piloderma croceum F 1598]
MQISIRDKRRTGPPDGGPLPEIPLVKTMDWSGTSGWPRSLGISSHAVSTKTAHHSISRYSGGTSPPVNDRTFPQRFARAKPQPERSSKFIWEESTHGDEIREPPFQKTKELANPQWGMPLKPDSHSSMSRLSRRAGRQKILLDRMDKWQNNQLFVTNEYNTSDVPGYSSVDGYNPGKLEPPDTNGELSNQNCISNHSLYGQYRRPQWPENTHHERQKQTFAQRDGPDIKGGSTQKRTSQEQQDRINADYLVALELEREEVRRANLETSRLRAQLADAKRKCGYDEPRSGKVAMKVPVADCAQSLPKGSGLHRAMHGDRGSSDPSDSSSGTDDFRGNDLNHDLNSESDGSINYRGRDLFHKTPKSDHSSDSEGIRRRKREKRRQHRAKLQELKYQQSFLKQDPPFKYSGEIQASLFKKWVREVWDWIKRGRMSTQQGIELSGKYCGGRAYKFFERDILNVRKKYLLAEYFEAMFDYLFPATFRWINVTRLMHVHNVTCWHLIFFNSCKT